MYVDFVTRTFNRRNKETTDGGVSRRKSTRMLMEEIPHKCAYRYGAISALTEKLEEDVILESLKRQIAARELEM